MVLDSRPFRGTGEIASVLGAIVAAARRRIWITNAYFAPRQRAVRALGDAARRGVDVRLLLPGRTDVPLVRHAGHGYYADLLRRGVRVYEYQPAVLHCKTLVADDYLAFAGSSNLDFRSFHFNAECNVVMLDADTGKTFSEAFEADLEKSFEITQESWRRRSVLHRTADALARSLGPLLSGAGQAQRYSCPMAAPAVPEAPLLVGGERPQGTEGEHRLVFDPATGNAIASVAQATPEDVDRAARQADETYRSDWKRRTPKERAAVLFRLAARIRDGLEELARLESRNTGKPIGSARGEVSLGADCFEYYAGAATKFGGSTIPVSARGVSATFREPIGVCGLIVPWNFPFAIATWKIAPALAMGNTVIVKPASDTPLSALRLGELALDAGVPPGAFHVLPGPGETVGAALVSHPLVRKISFTGSTEAGKSVMRRAADGIKRVSLELGGKSACLIFEDADLSTAIPSALWSVFDNAGQDCCARSRFLVQRTVYDRVVADLADRAAAIRVGDPLSPETEMGPLITAAHREKVRRWLSIGDEEGARRVTGGEVPADPALSRGSFLTPAVLADVDNDMQVAREEIFGPVVSVIPFRDEEEAVRLANASRYGLSGSLFTRDLGRAMRVARNLETGVLSVNSSRSVFLEAPFGGVKESGLGRELGLAALEHYTETKTVFFSEE